MARPDQFEEQVADGAPPDAVFGSGQGWLMAAPVGHKRGRVRDVPHEEVARTALRNVRSSGVTE